ncbi:MAG: hypothetical protein KDD40_12760, partial [Bdellovibrionales bacterium]|nr:hypothetical protein [Bdellovibrionales bacterium]
LLVKFGFEKCPWCLNLHKVFNTNLKTFIDKNFVKAEINISEESGKKVFENIKGSYKESYKKTGWPFLIVVNPQANTSTYQDTAELEDNAKGQKGHDIAKVKMALENMAKKLN